MRKQWIAPLLLLITLTFIAAAQVVPGRVRVSSDIMQGLLVKKVRPEYQGDAKHIQGTVVLKAVIDKEGNISKLQLISGHPMLAPAAIEAVKQWKYRPYLLNGEPVEVETNVTVNFTLSDNPPAEGVVGDMPGGIPGGERGGIVSGIMSGAPVPQRVRVPSGVMQALLVKKVPPQYPQDAKDQHIEGVVVLKAVINKEGNVSNLGSSADIPCSRPPQSRRSNSGSTGLTF